MTAIRKIIAGGQTGADRAGLDFALANQIPIGGWCPKGRRAEDGIVPSRYQLREHPASAYQPRTIQNIDESDLTAVFARAPLSPGSRYTLKQCRHQGKKHVWLAGFPDAEADAKCLRAALSQFDGILNIAGSRESKCPGNYEHVLRVLRLATAELTSVRNQEPSQPDRK
ncbi:MAG: putative molybdenum carrier protein [bacterium]|nr:putative molybdenum carrier protein [bacterium]